MPRQKRVVLYIPRWMALENNETWVVSGPCCTAVGEVFEMGGLEILELR
jgi:hypothetical protein